MTRSSDPRPRLLLTRPRDGSERFARDFRTRFGAGWPVTIAPLMEIVPTGAPLPAADSLIFTSEQAITAVAGKFASGARAWCVGQRTAEAARAAGFDVVEGPGDAKGLARAIITAAPAGRLLHVRGAEIAFPLAKTLNHAGIETVEAVVYHQEPRPLSAEAASLLRGAVPVLIPVFSPRSGALLAKAAAGATAPLWLAPLSEAVVRACAEIPAARCEIAARPEAAALLDAVQRLIGADEAG